MSSEVFPKPGKSIFSDSTTAPVLPFPIPGSTPDGIYVQLLNVDIGKGIVTTVIHIRPGASIPAHYHRDGAEAHFVLEGDFLDAGNTYAAGAFLTHPVGVVHGPHGSVHGCRVLTLQTSFVDPANPDFHIVENS